MWAACLFLLASDSEYFDQTVECFVSLSNLNLKLTRKEETRISTSC